MFESTGTPRGKNSIFKKHGVFMCEGWALALGT